MIRIYLSGGLGNQMFQYAMARALSLETGKALVLDTHLFDKKTKATPRVYELDIFNINSKNSNSTIEKYILKVYRSLHSSPTLQDTYASFVNIYSDRRTSISDLINMLPNKQRIRLFGYFQNEIYFKEFESQIRKDFIFKNALSEQNKEVANLMQLQNSVSLHIRRGDYLAKNSNLRNLPLSYYKKAISYINNKIEEPYYFIFSDDMNWVRDNLEINSNHTTYVDWNNGAKSYLDMQLMVACKHNIIANSSFSWWAAWLNTNPDRIVLAPPYWYKNDKENNFQEGFLPQDWKVLL